MFVDFNRVFNSKPQTELRIPDAMVEHLNSKLPRGVKYKADDNGNCEIVSDFGSMTIGGLILVPTDEHKKILGKNFTYDDVLNYSYNAQKPIPIKLKKDGFILLNGEEFPIERIRYNPYYPVSYVSGTMYMYPHPFPNPVSLEVGCDNYSRELTFNRVPNESIHISAFESQKNQPLYVRYFLDENNHTIDFSISFNLSNAKTIRDIVESTFIYNAFIDGHGLFCGHPLGTDVDTSKIKKYDVDSMIFWEKVFLIEETLGINFKPPQEDVDFSTICKIEELYQNLINKRPIRDNKKIESLDGEWEMCSDKDVTESIGKSIYFEFQATSRIALFDVDIELPCVIGIFDATLSNYTVKGSKYKLSLAHLSEEKHMYTSSLHFRTEEELQEYMAGDHNERINLLCVAKTTQEYLKMQGD